MIKQEAIEDCRAIAATLIEASAALGRAEVDAAERPESLEAGWARFEAGVVVENISARLMNATLGLYRTDPVLAVELRRDAHIRATDAQVAAMNRAARRSEVAA